MDELADLLAAPETLSAATAPANPATTATQLGLDLSL
jgi:hypothetical protein